MDSNKITNCNTDTYLLKIIAIVFMFIDHMGASIYPKIFELRILGRISFPLFAWGMVLGCDYSKNMYKYILRVLLLGIISQPLYMLVLGHTWTQLNIMFTLTLSLIGILGIKINKYGSQIILPVLSLVVATFADVDYGFRGVLFVILLYLSRKDRGALIATFIAYALFWGTGFSVVDNFFGINMPWSNIPALNALISPFFRIQSLVWLALPFILIKTKSGIHIPKLLGYSLYPLHLIVLYLLQKLLIN